ncbi:MAG: hypothetical protein ABW021_07675 [Acidimicrobiia bacterium]
MRLRMTILTAVLLFASACDGGTDATTTTPSTIPTTPTTVPTTTTTTIAATTSTVGETTTTGQEIDVIVDAGEVSGPGRFTFTVGDPVSIWMLSDVDAEIHVHGYDLFFEAMAGVPIEIALTADVPGIWEVELEETHVPLFVLEVTP